MNRRSCLSGIVAVGLVAASPLLVAYGEAASTGGKPAQEPPH